MPDQAGNKELRIFCSWEVRTPELLVLTGIVMKLRGGVVGLSLSRTNHLYVQYCMSHCSKNEPLRLVRGIPLQWIASVCISLNKRMNIKLPFALQANGKRSRKRGCHFSLLLILLHMRSGSMVAHLTRNAAVWIRPFPSRRRALSVPKGHLEGLWGAAEDPKTPKSYKYLGTKKFLLSFPLSSWSSNSPPLKIELTGKLVRVRKRKNYVGYK
jgi:hypothetical protein